MSLEILEAHTRIESVKTLFAEYAEQLGFDKLGFREIPPYYTNPHGNAVYLGITLDHSGGKS